MEIKQGDKVRVSSRVPRIYERFGSMIAPHYECKVVEIDDGMALLDSIPAKHIFLFPLKYLVKVDAEAKEAKIKLGDMVRVKNLHEPFCLDAERHLEITNIPPRAVSQKEWKVINVEVRRDCAGHIYTLNNGDSFIYNIPEDCVELVEPTEQTQAQTDANEKLQEEYARFMSGHTPISFADRIEQNRILHRMRVISQDDFLKEINPAEHEVNPKPRLIPKIMFNTEFWVKYEADLAKEIALKLVNNENPNKIGEVAAKVAKSVVENLKK